MSREQIDRFHAHLDDCSQCRNNPFALCPIGVTLIHEAAWGKRPNPLEKEPSK